MDILIVQSGVGGKVIVKDSLARVGLENGRDYQFFRGPLGVEEALVKGRRQLLITGGLSTDPRTTAIFVEMLQETNPELVCLSFSSASLPGHFDGIIQKTSGRAVINLALAVIAFQGGIINRTKGNVCPIFSYEKHKDVLLGLLRGPRFRDVRQEVDVIDI